MATAARDIVSKMLACYMPIMAFVASGFEHNVANMYFIPAGLFIDGALGTPPKDNVVVTAGVFVPPDTDGRIEDRLWGLTFGVNVTGAYIVADEANRVFRQQGVPATVVLTTSANAVVAKKGSLAYDTSKAAANHLVRELAVEMAPLVRVNAVAPATVVKGSTMFPRDRVIRVARQVRDPVLRVGDDRGAPGKARLVLRGALARGVADRAYGPGGGD